MDEYGRQKGNKESNSFNFRTAINLLQGEFPDEIEYLEIESSVETDSIDITPVVHFHPAQNITKVSSRISDLAREHNGMAEPPRTIHVTNMVRYPVHFF